MSARFHGQQQKKNEAGFMQIAERDPFDKSVPQFLKYVIPRKGYALTWESPSTISDFAVQNDEWYQEIATSLRSSQ